MDGDYMSSSSYPFGSGAINHEVRGRHIGENDLHLFAFSQVMLTGDFYSFILPEKKLSVLIPNATRKLVYP